MIFIVLLLMCFAIGTAYEYGGPAYASFVAALLLVGAFFARDPLLVAALGWKALLWVFTWILVPVWIVGMLAELCHPPKAKTWWRLLPSKTIGWLR
jgi:hypothetical protein